MNVHNFDDFNDFRVIGWMKDGLVTLVESVCEPVVTSAKYAAAALVMGVAATGASTFIYSKDISSVVAPNGEVLTSESRYRDLTSEIDREIKSFGSSDVSYIDSSIIELAREALASISQGKNRPLA